MDKSIKTDIEEKGEELNLGEGEFQLLMKEIEEIKTRLGRIEVELSKMHNARILNLTSNNDVDKIWSDEDNTIWFFLILTEEYYEW